MKPNYKDGLFCPTLHKREADTVKAALKLLEQAAAIQPVSEQFHVAAEAARVALDDFHKLADADEKFDPDSEEDSRQP